MIEIFEGRIGSGKSYAAVRRIASHLAEGLTVCTNIALNWEGLCKFIREEYGREPLPEQLMDLQGTEIDRFHTVTPMGSPGAPVLIVLDECHLWFNARDFAKADRQLLAFLTQSRKQDTDIIFISQSAENIDKQFRRLVQYVWRFRDLRKTAVPGLGIKWGTMLQIITFGMHSGEMLLAVQFDYDGKTQMGREFVTMDKKVFAAYDTKALLSNFQRSGVRGRIKVIKTKTRAGAVLRLVMLMAFVGMLIFWWRWKTDEGKKAEAKTQEALANRNVVTPKSSVDTVPAQNAMMQITHSGTPRFQTSAGRVDIQQMAEEAQAEYEIFAEQFIRYQSGKNMPGPLLKTAQGVYRKGAMSNHGYVVGVEERQAVVVQPNGRMGWVVAEEGNGSLPALADGQQGVDSRTPKIPAQSSGITEREPGPGEHGYGMNRHPDVRPIGVSPKEWARHVAAESEKASSAMEAQK